MSVQKNRSHSRSSDSVQEEHMTMTLLRQVSPDPEFLIQQTESRENQGELTNAIISDRVQPCENVKGDTRTTPEESSVSEFHQMASDNLTGLGQSGECTSHCRDVMLAQDNRNVEGLPSAEDKLVNDKKKTNLCLSSLVEDPANQYKNKCTVKTEKDTFENDQALVQDTCENHKSSVHNSYIPEHQIVPDLRRKRLSVRMSYMLFSVHQPNRPYLVARMTYIRFSVHQPNGPYLVARMTYIMFSVHHRDGPYLVAKTMYMKCVLLCRNKSYALYSGKACMKLVCYLFVKDFNVTRKGCFPKSDQQKYGNKFLRSLSTQLYNQVVQVYAVVNNNYMYGNGVLTQTNTDVLAVSDHESPLQLFDPQQHQHDAVEILDGPIQHPAQNDAGVLAIADHESTLQLYNQHQHQNNPVAVEILDGPIQHPAQNGAVVLAITDHESTLQLYNQHQHQNNPVAVEILDGPIQHPAQNDVVLAIADHEPNPNANNQHADQNQQLAMGIAVAFVVMAILIKIFFI